MLYEDKFLKHNNTLIVDKDLYVDSNSDIYSNENLMDIVKLLKDRHTAIEIIEKCKKSITNKLRLTQYFEHGNCHFQIDIIPILNSNEDVYKLALRATDITEIYNMKLDAEKSAKSKTSFLARTSHEIRTPMNAIIGMIELILREDISDEVKEYAYSIKSAGSNLLSIINDILDLSKVEAGELSIVESEYEFASIINDVINMFSIQLDDVDIDILVEFDSKIPYKMYGDEIRIRQVIVNLVNNAIKYTDKGYVKIKSKLLSLDDDGVWISVSVEDSGIGIKEHELNGIFESFKQVDLPKNRHKEGTGLGLAICKTLVDSMGGEISVESKYGKGSKFEIKLYQKITEYKKSIEIPPESINEKIIVYEPNKSLKESLKNTMSELNLNCEYEDDLTIFKSKLVKYKYDYAFIQVSILDGIKSMCDIFNQDIKIVVMLDSEQSYNLAYDVSVIPKPIYSLPIASILNDEKQQIIYNRDRVLDNQKFSAPNANILIVDDNEVNLKVAKGLMKEYKFDIETALSGYEAIEKIMKKDYNIVFMDYMMPKMDGIEATKIIRKMKNGKYKDIVIIALTANAIMGAKDMFLENNMDDFISKPIELKKLNEILNKWIPNELKSEFECDIEKKCEDNKKLRNLYGIDSKSSIKLNQFTNEIYLELLETFLNDGKNKVIKINQYIKTDIDMYRIDVHGTKSAAASIGAYELSKKARLLEEACKKDDLDYVYENNLDFTTEYNKVLNSIQENYSFNKKQEISQEEINEQQYIDSMRNIKKLLEEFDSENALKEIKNLRTKKLDEEIQNKIVYILELIEMFEYEQAIEMISYM